MRKEPPRLRVLTTLEELRHAQAQSDQMRQLSCFVRRSEASLFHEVNKTTG